MLLRRYMVRCVDVLDCLVAHRGRGVPAARERSESELSAWGRRGTPKLPRLSPCCANLTLIKNRDATQRSGCGAKEQDHGAAEPCRCFGVVM